MNDHHIYRHPQQSYSDNHLQPPHHSMVPHQVLRSCPVAVSTYAALHLDSVSKILNHIVAVTVVCDIFLFLSSFSVSYLDHHLGFNTVLCSFLLSAVSVTVLLIINNSRISALPVLAPTEFMVGVATGITIGAAVLAAILSTTYHTATECDKVTATGNQTSNNDPVLKDTCANHASSMTAIWFWAGLVAWLNVVASMLLVTCRHELSAHYQQYETIGSADSTNPVPPVHDFEETFRRQQQEILGSQQAAAVRDRAAAMFVGDYATIPEVTHGSVASNSMSTVSINGGKNSESAQILSV